MKFTPLPSVFIHIFITLLFLHLGLVVLRASILAMSFFLWVGVSLKERKGNIFSIERIMDQKIPF
jgi:hypothetical protein